MENELKQGSTYIIKGKNAGNDRQVYKITVLELTKTSIFCQYIDSGASIRDTLDEFNYSYKIIEDVECL